MALDISNSVAVCV